MDVQKKLFQYHKYSEQWLDNNKNIMLQIMQSAPVAGVYAGENILQFQSFFDFYIAFLKAQTGPRGDCSKAVREILSKDPQFYDEILKLVSKTHKSHIRDIYVKYKMYSPCPQYDQFLKNTDALKKSEEAYQNMMDENSIMYQSIKKGMIDKRGEAYDYQNEIIGLQNNYKIKIQTMKKYQDELLSEMIKNQKYEKYMKLKQVMTPFFAMWKEADKKVGFQSIEKGDSFEKVVQAHIIPIILKRTNINQQQKFKVETNCRWMPKTLGQIDIAILIFKDDIQKWEVKVLIECKSRLFDVREAYKQVGELHLKGKQKLCTTMGIIDVDQNYDYFIVTTLPQNPFLLPIQSKMKQNLEKASKNVPIEEIQSDKVYVHLKEVFKDELSPLDWFMHSDSDRIIVLSY